MLGIFLNGASLEVEECPFVGKAVLERCRPARFALPPGRDEPPYLFCGNGACRDCNLLIEGLPDLPSCRLPLSAGLSLRTREADGSDNALSLAVGEVEHDAPLSCEVIVVGAGPAGLAAARAAVSLGSEVVVLEARAVQVEGVLGATPAVAIEGKLFCYREGVRRPVAAGAIVIATGASEHIATFPGSTLPGVLPADLVERYLEREFLPGQRFLVSVTGERGKTLAARLTQLGAVQVKQAPPGTELVAIRGRLRVEAARLAPVSREEGEIEVSVDTVVVAGPKLPSLGLARALGCRTRYDPVLGGDCADVKREGASSVPGVFIAGDAAGPGSEEDWARAGRASARWAPRRQ